VENPVENTVNNWPTENLVDKWSLYPQVIHKIVHLIHSFYPQQKGDGNRGLSHLSTLSTGPITTTIILKNLRTEVKGFKGKNQNWQIQAGHLEGRPGRTANFKNKKLQSKSPHPNTANFNSTPQPGRIALMQSTCTIRPAPKNPSHPNPSLSS
jgi:hypothetical protein